MLRRVNESKKKTEQELLKELMANTMPTFRDSDICQKLKTSEYPVKYTGNEIIPQIEIVSNQSQDIFFSSDEIEPKKSKNRKKENCNETRTRT
jgi:hypothetical protein